MISAKDYDMDGKDKRVKERSCLTKKDIVDWNLELRTNNICMDEHNTDQRKKKFEYLEKCEYQRRQTDRQTSEERERENDEREKQNDVREMSNHDRELKNRERERVNDERELKIMEKENNDETEKIIGKRELTKNKMRGD